MRFTRFLTAAALLLAAGAPAMAQSVTLEFQNGNVTLVAQNASIRTILNEWGRLGGTTIVNSERVSGAPLTIELRDVPERQALDIVLRSVSGYMVAGRAAGSAGASSFDRILIVPTSSAPTGAPPAASVSRPGNNMPFAVSNPPPPVVSFDADDPEEDPPNDVNVGEQQQQRRPPNPRVRVPRDFVPPERPTTPLQTEAPEDREGARTPSNRTGANPFGVQPGSTRPGVITPVPQQQQEERDPDPEP